MELKLAGGRLRINILLIPVCALLVWQNGWERFLCFSGALLLHETAHLLAASALGVRVISLELLPFGCAAHMGSFAFVSKGKEALTAAAGPIGNLLAALACEALSGEVGRLFAQCNIVLGAMNLLPSLPLDGGRIAAVLLSVFLPGRTALIAASVMGMIAGTGICAAGILIGGSGSISFYVMGGFMVYSSAKGLRPRELDALAFSSAKLRGLSRNAVMEVKNLACSGEKSIGEVFLSLDQRRYNIVHVIDSELRVRGVIDEGMLMQRMLREGSSAKLKKESEHFQLRP